MIFWIVVAGVVVICAGALWMFIRKVAGMKGDVDAAKAEFQQQVGYEYASGLTVGKDPTRRKSTPDGDFIHHYEVYSDGSYRVTAQSWLLEHPRPSKPSFQVVDKKLIGTTQKLLNLVGPVKRTITISMAGPHPIGDTDLDARFALYTADVPGSIAILRQPEVRKSLLDLAAVFLLADAGGVMFGDSTDANVYAQGASRTDLNPAPSIRSAARVHIAIEKLLKQVIDAGP